MTGEDGVCKDENMLHLGRMPCLICTLLSLLLPGCASPNTVANREVVSAQIPAHIKQFAFGIQAPIAQMHLSADARSRLGLELRNFGTAQLLPGGNLLTAAHVLDKDAQPGKKVLLLLDADYVIAEVLVRHDGRENGDWTLLRPRLWTDVAGTEPGRIQRRLADPMRCRVRYDGDAEIPAGTRLFAFGYIFAAEMNDPDIVPIAATIVPGIAASNLSPPGEIRMDIDVPLIVHGMSGGPIGYFDESSDTLVIVGMLKGGLRPRSAFGEQPAIELSGERLTPAMLHAGSP